MMGAVDQVELARLLSIQTPEVGMWPELTLVCLERG